MCPNRCARPELKEYTAQCCCSNDCCKIRIKAFETSRSPEKMVETEMQDISPTEKTRLLFDLALRANEQQQADIDAVKT
jgi:hypothetical protein